MKRLPALACPALAALTSAAQLPDATLKGRVTDATTKEALIGVNVVYAPGKGTATDLDGSYTLMLPAGQHQLTFSSVGHTTYRETVTLAAGETRVLDVRLTMAAAQLDMVVVSAGRFEQRVGEVTQSLSVLRPELIQNKNAVSLEHALEQVPGVVIVDDDPQIRAGSGFSYGAGSRVQVLVDDIPILSGDIGRPNWTFLPLENLEQVEVIKGASSVLYGSAALSGVINVRTAYPRSKPATRATVFSGVYDAPGHAPAKWWGANAPMMNGANFFHSRQFGALDLVLGGNVFGDNGHIGPEPLVPDTLAADPYRLGPGGYDQRVRFNTGLRWRNRRVQGLNYGINANAMRSRSTSIFIWSDTDRGLFRPEPGTVTRTLGSQFYVDPFVNYYTAAGTRHSVRGRFHHQTFDNDNEQSNSNNTTHGEYQVQQKMELFGETMITAGLMGRSTLSTAELYRGNEAGEGRNTSSNVAAYLQVDKKIIERISLSAGLRYEQFRVNDDEASQPVFRAGATWQVLEATFLRASYGQGFRFPTIGERFIRTNVGLLNIFPNADLRAEQSWNIEGGIKQGFKLGGFMGYLDAVVFQQEFQDYVEFTFGQWSVPSAQIINGQLVIDPGLGFKSVNTGGARVSGFELEMAGKGQVGKVDITTLMGYTWTLPVSTTPEQVYGSPAFSGDPYTFLSTSFDPTDNILKFRVRNLFRADVQADYKRLMAGVSVRYNSHVRNIDKIFVELDETPVDAFSLRTGVGQWMRDHRTGDTIVDARVGISLSDHSRLALIVNNLTNEVYSLRPLAIEAPRHMQVQLTVSL
ncbi:MAG: TonB-dependent receptor [Flavobacteriales bacterium]|nr:TonB-dependent receptor [Flavobacteriales bacterium]